MRRPWRWWARGMLLAGWVALAMTVRTAMADEERAYLGGAPNEGWLALWTQDGVYAVQLGDGCDGVGAGDNVLIDGDTLRVVDPLLGVQDRVCTVAVRIKKDDAPCATNPEGVCDVAWSR